MSTRDEQRQPQRVEFLTTLYRLMEQKGVSQRALARAMGWGSHTVIQAWAAREPHPDVVFALEEALDVRPGTLSRIFGYVPVGVDPVVDQDPIKAIEADEVLPEWGKKLLLCCHEQIMEGLGRGRGRR